MTDRDFRPWQERAGEPRNVTRERIAELEARCAELAHSYDETFKRRVALEAMVVRLCEDLDAELGPGRVDVNWPELRDLART